MSQFRFQYNKIDHISAVYASMLSNHVGKISNVIIHMLL